MPSGVRGARSPTTWPTTGGPPSGCVMMPMTRVMALAGISVPWAGSCTSCQMVALAGSASSCVSAEVSRQLRAKKDQSDALHGNPCAVAKRARANGASGWPAAPLPQAPVNTMLALAGACPSTPGRGLAGV
ncbi:hypothetical protein G6F68_018836 [Rhizopus microsporus]|nr:hypothetical protein G6F68_018836 [Rhizopus microsporus]